MEVKKVGSQKEVESRKSREEIVKIKKIWK